MHRQNEIDDAIVYIIGKGVLIEVVILAVYLIYRVCGG